MGTSKFFVFLIDDDCVIVNSWRLLFYSRGFKQVILSTNPQEVMQRIASTPDIGVVVLDIYMPGISGVELLKLIVRDHPEIPVIMSTGMRNTETIVQCMKIGAFDYLVKPIENNRLITTVKRALEVRELRRENSQITAHLLAGKIEHPEIFSAIITRSTAMLSIFKYLEAISTSVRPLTILGETGTGKELIAKVAHKQSGCQGALITINVAGLDDNLFSDTLFGHEIGAFTGANKRRPGQIERACHGTLFLDEIGDLTPGSQIKLLRLLQEREYFPLGADIPKYSDARILVASNKDLKELVDREVFRKDLFYRLQSHIVHLPPLRERLEDIPLLLDHFLKVSAEVLKKRKPTPPKELPTLLSTYSFPGNIRELEAMVFDAVSRHHSGMLSMAVFHKLIGQQQKRIPIQYPQNSLQSSSKNKALPLFSSLERPPTLKEAAEMAIKEAMRRSNSNQKIAATMLGISQPSLSRRLTLLP